jgi:serine protease DegQ
MTPGSGTHDGPRMRRTATWRRVLGPLAVVSLVAVGCNDDDDDAATDGDAEIAVDQAGEDRAGLGSVTALVEELRPSVVAVTFAVGEQQGAGSGVIVRPDGVIVTNAHVVAPAVAAAQAGGTGVAEVDVLMADGTRMVATVEATDVVTDLAVLRVDRDDLPAAVLADSFPDVGDLAVAIGNPLGFDNTVTAGIISGLQRSLPDELTGGSQALVDLIQTDAAISPGNSGGALVNADAEVVGITVAYVPPALGAVSLGFAIPAPTVSAVVEALLADGRVDHVYLGVQVVALTPQVADRFDMEVERGVVVIEAEPDAPAAIAGVRSGDVITELGGSAVEDVGDLLTQLRRFTPGDTVEVTVQRNGEQLELVAELAARPTD